MKVTGTDSSINHWHKSIPLNMFAFVRTRLTTSHATERISYPSRPRLLPQMASFVVVIVMDRVLDKVTVSPFPNAANSSIPPVTFGITVETEVNVSTSVAGANAAAPLAATPRTIMIIIMIDRKSVV